jgi:hypothetical protein
MGANSRFEPAPLVKPQFFEKPPLKGKGMQSPSASHIPNLHTKSQLES